MTPELDILPGVGLGPWRFGMTIRDACSVATADYDWEETPEGDVSLDFDDIGVSLSFHADDDYRLVAIHAYPESRATFRGYSIFELRRPDVLTAFKGVVALVEQKRPDVLIVYTDDDAWPESGEVVEAEQVPDDERSWDAPDQSLTLCFDADNENLKSVIVGVAFGKDHQIIWPPTRRGRPGKT